MNKSELADRYQLLHLVHQGYLGALWAARGIAGEAAGLPALVRRIQLPAGLSEQQQSVIAEAAWDSLELSHECLLKVGEVVFADGVFAVAYDYAEAEVLQALLLMGTVKKTPLAPDVVARILLDVVEGLQATSKETQDMGINPHGGVTPESIVVGSDGRARLIDSVVGAVASSVPAVRMNPNRVGYCAPEQLKGQACDERSDVFSLGILLAELLAGRRFLLGAAASVEQKIIEGKLPKVQGWLKPERGIDAKLINVLDRAIEADREKRPVSLQALADDVCSNIASPASRAQVGAAVYGLAAKQLEVRGRKLGLSTGPRLSERVTGTRAPRSSPRVQMPAAAAQATLQAPRAVDVSSLENDAPTLASTKPEADAAAVVEVSTPKAPVTESIEAKVDSQRATTVAVQHRSEMGTLPGLAPPPATLIGGLPDRAPSSSQAIDDLLGDLEVPSRPGDKRDDMQSGTHRKVLTTLIGVAPPPRPNIGGPPPLAIPTDVALVTAPAAPREAAGIADLLRTAVPSKRDGVSLRPATEAIVPAPRAAKPPLPPVQDGARDPISAALSTEPPPPSSQLERYRRLAIFFGATTVLFLTLLCWVVFDSTLTTPISNSATKAANVGPVSARASAASPSTSAAPASSSGKPAASAVPTRESSSASAASASAQPPKKPTATSVKPTTRAPVVQRKPTKKKVFVPDDI